MNAFQIALIVILALGLIGCLVDKERRKPVTIVVGVVLLALALAACGEIEPRNNDETIVPRAYIYCPEGTGPDRECQIVTEGED